MLASTLKLRPRYFFIVLALAGDSTITRLVLPLATAPLPVLALAAEEARVLFLAGVVLLLVVPVVFLVVAITLFILFSSHAQT
jgi:hypothetical protein